MIYTKVKRQMMEWIIAKKNTQNFIVPIFYCSIFEREKPVFELEFLRNLRFTEHHINFTH